MRLSTRHAWARWYVLAALVAAPQLSGCPSPEPEGDCADGRDNDNDGFIDFDDFGCIHSDGFLEPDPPICNDGRDNDNDGLIDSEDFGCETPDDTSEDDPLRQCNDGIDNDDDGLIDYGDQPQNDPGCDTPVDNDEFTPPQCIDENDNDSDGFVDYPLDPGCATPDDDDETTPDVLPMCSDGMDNDLDGFADYPLDPGCDANGDDNEFNVTVGACGPSVLIEDITLTREASNTIDGPTANELTSPICGGFGGEFAYTYQIMEPTALVISTDHPETTLDTVVYIRPVCQQPASELACSDDDGIDNRRASYVLIPYIEPGSYYILVDAFSPGSLGDFRLTIEEVPGPGAMCDPLAPNCLDGLECRELVRGEGFTCEPPICNDTIDNDEDGFIDYPADPGCASPDGDDEQFPNPITQCSDGVDNDMDGAMDYPDEVGCASASDDFEDTCLDQDSVVDISYQPMTVGVTSSANADHTGSCSNTAMAKDIIHRLKVPGMMDSISMNTMESSFDTVLYVRQAICSSSELACDDTGSINSTIELTDVAPDDYFIVIDGWNTSAGMYNLNISGVIADDAVCDALQVASGIFACNAGKTCTDDGMGAMRCL